MSETRVRAKLRAMRWTAGDVFLEEAGEVLGGLVLLAVGEGVVLVEDAAVVCGEGDAGGDGDEVGRGLAGVGIVGEGGGGFAQDGAVEGGVGVGGVGGDDAVLGAGVELADDGLGEGGFGVEGLGLGGEDGDGEGAGVGGKVRGGAYGVVATAGCGRLRGRGVGGCGAWG